MRRPRRPIQLINQRHLKMVKKVMIILILMAASPVAAKLNVLKVVNLTNRHQVARLMNQEVMYLLTNLNLIPLTPLILLIPTT